MATEVTQAISTVSEVMQLMAPSAGGSVPDENSEEYAQWLLFIQMKYDEAARRGFWRRLLTHETLDVTAGDTELLLPVRFGRANALYVFEMDDLDLANPYRDKTLNEQNVFIEQINDPDDDNFGRWQAVFAEDVESDTEVHLWYFATPPKPTDSEDKLLLPGDMIAFGALSEVFRSTNLEGSQDDARSEYESRLATYLALEMIPPRNELLTFETNPKRLNRTTLAREQYRTGRNRLRNV